MKVIGRVANDRILVEMSDTDLARATGYHSVWSMKREKGADPRNFDGDRFIVGVEVDVHRRWTMLDDLMNRERQIADAAKLFRTMADMLDAGVPTALVGFPGEEKANG